MQAVSTLEKMVDEELEEVRRRLIHRYVHVSTVDVKNDRAGTLSRNEILLNLRFIRRFPDAVPKRIVVRMLIARMMNRRIRVPKDLQEYALMYLAVRGAVYSEVPARRILRSLLHLINDDDLWSRGFAEEIQDVYRASAACPVPNAAAGYWQVLAAALERRWGSSFGVAQRLTPVHSGLARRLASLPYGDRSRRFETAGDFAQLVSTMFRFQPAVKAQSSAPKGSPSPKEEEPPSVWPLVGDDAADDLAGLSGIDAGVSALLGDLKGEGLGELLLEAFSIQGAGAALLGGKRGAGRWWWYRHLARQYEIPVAPRQSTLDARAYPVELRSWTMSDPVESYDAIASYGQLLPSIARRRLYTGGESEYADERIPDLVLAIDSSGSMRNPQQHKSFAVLAGCVAARSYLGNSGRVAVFNFSSESVVLDFSADEQRVLQHICTYQGAGTKLAPEVLDSLLRCGERTARPIDVLMISDMGIGNLNDVVAKIASYERTHRVFIFHVQCTPEAFSATQERFVGLPHVEAYRIENQEDLPAIVLGRVSSSILGREQAQEQGTTAQSAV